MVDFAIGWNAQVRAAQVSPSEPIAKRPRIVRPNSDDDSQMVLSQGMEAVQLQAGDGSPKPPELTLPGYPGLVVMTLKFSSML